MCCYHDVVILSPSNMNHTIDLFVVFLFTGLAIREKETAFAPLETVPIFVEKRWTSRLLSLCFPWWFLMWFDHVGHLDRHEQSLVSWIEPILLSPLRGAIFCVLNLLWDYEYSNEMHNCIDLSRVRNSMAYDRVDSEFFVLQCGECLEWEPL